MLNTHHYLEFLEKFAQLNAYQLDHFCQHITDQYALLKPDAKDKPTLMEIRHILTESIKQTHLFLAEQQVEQAKLEFDALKSLYLPQKKD